MSDSSATKQPASEGKDTAGEQWEPSNGMEFMDFLSCICSRCIRLHGRRSGDDPDEYNCSIVQAAMDRSMECGTAPIQWQMKNGAATCIEFVRSH